MRKKAAWEQEVDRRIFAIKVGVILSEWQRQEIDDSEAIKDVIYEYKDKIGEIE